MNEIRKIFGSDLTHLIYPYLNLKNRFYIDCEDLISKNSDSRFYHQKNHVGLTPFDSFVEALFRKYIKNDISKYKYMKKFRKSFHYNNYGNLLSYFDHKNIMVSEVAKEMYKYIIFNKKEIPISNSNLIYFSFDNEKEQLVISEKDYEKRENYYCDIFNVIRIHYYFEYSEGNFLKHIAYFADPEDYLFI
jgi:hypothetical protein